MKNNQYINYNNNNVNNYSYSKSNYINPNTQNINNIYRNQQSTNINNPDNSMTINSPLSATINYGNFDINSQRQLDNSSNLINPNDNLSKTLSNRPIENTIINRDSKIVSIKKITKKPNNNNNQNRNIINKNDNRFRNKVNKTNIQQQNIANNSARANPNNRLINNQNKLINKTNPNIMNTNINNKKNKNNDDDSDENDDYGNPDDDDFNNILRETINIRNTQYNLTMNNNNVNMLNNSGNNPFLKSKSETNKFTNNLNLNKNQNQNINNNIDNNLKNIQNIQNKINEEKKNIMNNLENVNANLNLNNKKENKNIINNNLNKINPNINNNNNLNKIKQIPKKINEEKKNLINNLKNKNSNVKLNESKNKYNNIINDNLGKINQNINETENKVYNSINNYFDNINLEQDKMNKKISDNINKDKNLGNINLGKDNVEKNIDKKKNYVKLDDFFGDNDQNFETLENKENNLNDGINNMILDNFNVNPEEKDINNNYFDNLDNLNKKDNFVNKNNDKFNDYDNNNIHNKNELNIMNKNNINFDNNNLDEFNIISNDENIDNYNIMNNKKNNIINDLDNIFNENNNDIQNNNDFNNIINDNNIKNNIKINDFNNINNNNVNYNNHNFNINNENNFMNNNLSAALVKVDLDNPETKNQFINLSLSVDNMLKEIKFLERLKSISSDRLSYFKKKYQKDCYFMEKNRFENIFIDEKNVQIQSPLTLIFHYIFNPDTLLPESEKNFFETIFTKRGDQNYSMKYDQFELSEVPKYFDDFSYVNNLFNNFNKNDLNLFLEEINSWKETFSFEQQFKHPLFNFRREKSITMKDVATVYFISPYDLIIDYHSLGSELPLSDTFIVITQYRFHCDINYDTKKGKFIFKTSGQIFNTLQFVKETLLKKTIRNESNTTNKEELQINTWSPLKSVIEYEDKRNQEIVENIYEKYLLNNLNKYSKVLPPEYDIFNADNDENWNSFSDNNDIYNQNQNIYDYGEENYYGYSKRDMEDRNMVLLKYIAYFVIFLLVCQILWAMTYGRFSFRTLFNSFIVIILGYLLINSVKYI